MNERPFVRSGLRVPMCQAQLDLIEHQWLADQSPQEFDLVGVVIADPEIAHLALLVQLVERLGDLLRLDQTVRPVKEQNIEVVRAEALKTAINRAQDVLPTVVDASAFSEAITAFG